VALFFYGLNIFRDVAAMYFLLTSGRFIQNFAREYIMFLFFGVVVFFAIAVLNYYVLWWIVPNFLVSFVFYSHVYFLIPIVAIRSALASFGLGGKKDTPFEWFGDMKARFTKGHSPFEWFVAMKARFTKNQKSD
jgi:hypothetical protein